MSGPCEMYKINPLFEYPTSTAKPDCVYEIDSIHSHSTMQTGNVGSEKAAELTSDVDLASLEQRQERLLSQLENLSTKLQQIQQQITQVPSVATPNTNVEIAGSPMNQLESFADVVITASSSHQPFGLLVLTKWLQKSYKVLPLCHVHSSLINLDANKKSLFRNGIVKEYRRGQQDMLLTLIWKDVGADPSLMVSPTKQSAISGDVNIIRYLSALVYPSYQFSDPVNQTLVDTWLDLAHHSMRHGNNKERQAVLRSLNSHLGKNAFLVGGILSVADVGVLSAVLQTETASELSANIKRWIKSCCEDQSVSESLNALSINLV